jgi:hypothetical protein
MARKWPSARTVSPVTLPLASEQRNTITRATSSAAVSRPVAADRRPCSTIAGGIAGPGTNRAITTLVKMPAPASSRDDGRRVRISLTPKGDEAAQAVPVLLDDVAEQALRGLDAAERRKLVSLLERVRANLDWD